MAVKIIIVQSPGQVNLKHTHFPVVEGSGYVEVAFHGQEYGGQE